MSSKKSKIGIIYVAANIKSNKFYVGQTIKELDERVYQHHESAKYNDHKFARALKKYDKSDWIWGIVGDDIPIRFLNEMETFFVSLFDTYKGGYNSTPGGRNTPMVPETKKKISEALKGRSRPYMIEFNKGKKGVPLSESHKLKISKGLMGNRHSEETKIKMSKAQTGKVKSQTHRDNLSKSHMGKKMPEKMRQRMVGNERRAKEYKIIKPNGTSKIIKNLAKYCRENNLCRQHMIAVAFGRRKHHKGYRCESVKT